MAEQTRTVLKTYFETNDFPTQAQFVDLIDSLALVSESVNAWSAGGTYAIGDIVSDGGSLWICIDPVTGSGMAPQLDTVNWASTVVPQIQRFEVDSVADLVLLAGLPDGKVTTLLGYRVPGDGGGQPLIYHATGRSTIGAQENNLGTYFDGPGADDYHASVNPYVVNILQFGARPDVANDSTPFIQAAIDYCKSFSGTQTEIDLIWPGGAYKVTSLNFVACNRVTNKALGGVILNGTSVGGVSVVDVDGGLVTPTNYLNFEGGFSVQIGLGSETYQYGVKISGMTNSRWEMTASGAFSVNTIYINYSWDNPQLNFIADNSSGTAIATIFCDTGSVNGNRFYCRTSAVASVDIGTYLFPVQSIGMQLSGAANIVSGDFSYAHTGLRVLAGQGNTIISPYAEVNKYSIQFAGNASGNTISGGILEVSTDGAAYELSSSTNTTVIGGRVFGNVTAGQTNRSAFILGSACYGLNVSNVDIHQSNIDQAYTGTWRGLQGGFVRQMNTVCAHWVSFPPTAIPSTDVNTIDDYKESKAGATWAPVATNVTLAIASGHYTKIGNLCHLFFGIVFPANADGNNVVINGIPYPAEAGDMNGASFGLTNATDHTMHVTGSTLVIWNTAAVARTNAHCSGKQYYGLLTYRVA